MRPSRKHDLVCLGAILQPPQTLDDPFRITDQMCRHRLFDDRFLGRSERVLRRLLR